MEENKLNMEAQEWKSTEEENELNMEDHPSGALPNPERENKQYSRSNNSLEFYMNRILRRGNNKESCNDLFDTLPNPVREKKQWQACHDASEYCVLCGDRPIVFNGHGDILDPKTTMIHHLNLQKDDVENHYSDSDQINTAHDSSDDSNRATNRSILCKQEWELTPQDANRKRKAHDNLAQGANNPSGSFKKIKVQHFHENTI